jgi:hypothetical protein
VGPGYRSRRAQRARHGGPGVQALQAAALLLLCVLLCACQRSQEVNCVWFVRVGNIGCLARRWQRFCSKLVHASARKEKD